MLQRTSRMTFLLAAIMALLTFAFALPQAATNVVATTSLAPTPIDTNLAVATTGCVSDNFIQPWVVHNLCILDPANPTTADPSHISFSFYDPNEGLVLTTLCESEVTDGTVKLASGGYVACEDSKVRFQLEDGDHLLISRFYMDPCKGDPPYDSGIAYGDKDATFQLWTSGAGSLHFQQRMEMNVTRMS